MLRRRPTGRRVATVTLAAALVGGGLGGCGGTWEDNCTTTPAGVIECGPGQRPEPVTVTGELLDGGSYDLTRDRGTVVVVNFWGSWCPPCRAEADDLEAVYQATKASGVTFLGVNSRDDRDKAKAFEQGRVSFPSLFDPPNRVGLDFEVTPSSTPSTLILDRDGRIAVAIRRPTTAGELRPLVERIAAEKS